MSQSNLTTVVNDTFILKKFKGRPPSLIVHLHPNHFRFDQQDGSFSYHSEMRMFIDHLAQGTIPHDMLEELRKAQVDFYDGWLIVRVIDHKSLANAKNDNENSSEDKQTGSLHNYTPYITPSSYAPYPSREQSQVKSPRIKQESTSETDTQGTQERLDTNKQKKPGPKVYHVALRPTNMSKHVDLVLDAMAPDPRALNRRQSQAYMNARTPVAGAVPNTPISGVPPTPSAEKGPPAKKQKLKIDPKDLLEYEARVVNATAPPLYLEPVDSLEEVENLLELLTDPLYDHEPPSPKGRKRTFAELAADDAQAKEQERFLQIMDSRLGVNSNSTTAGTLESQNTNLFQPRFERWNTLEKIRSDLKERKARDAQRQLQEDEQRRAELEARRQQQREEQQKRQAIEASRARQAQMQAQQAQQAQAQAHLQQQAAQAAAARQAQARATEMGQPNGMPPNMQAHMMAGTMGQRSSPIVRQGSPNIGSSPMAANAVSQAQAVAMAHAASNQGAAGSPPRTGSAIPHGHPGAPMVRGHSAQGPSRNGTPQIPSGTPAIKNATPIIRQSTPNSRMSQASPHPNMMAPTPQMGQVNMMAPGQMPNGMPMNPMQRQQMQQLAMQNGMMANGGQQMTPAQMAQMQAQHAQFQQARAHQIAQAQAHGQQQPNYPNTPQMQHPSPGQNPRMAYKEALSRQQGSQMANLQTNPGSPMTNQQAAQQANLLNNMQQQQRQNQQMAQAQQQIQTNVQMVNGGQQRQPPNNMVMHLTQQFLKRHTQTLAQKYGSESQIPPNEMNMARQAALKQATDVVARNRQQQATTSMMRMQQNGQGSPQNVAQYMAMQQAGQAGQPMAAPGMQMNHQAAAQRHMMQQMAQQQALQQQQQAHQHAQQQAQQQAAQQQIGNPGGGGAMLNHDAQAYQQQVRL